MDRSPEYQIALLIAIGTVGMLLLAIGIISFMVFYQKKMISEQLKRTQMEFDHQQRMMQAELESQENERRRLAADLHDSIGGMLSAIRVGISTISKQSADPTIEQTKRMLDDTITSVRRISRDLMPSTLERFGLVQAIHEMCERFSFTTKLPIHFHEHGELSGLEKNKELMLFRITQELINNTIKHAQASNLDIHIEAGDTLKIVAEDDGIGFNIDEQLNSGRKGLGLFSIQNRSSLLGATLEYDKERKKGTRVTLTLPLKHEH
jgi:two-component system, NarL family, sensor kinase